MSSHFGSWSPDELLNLQKTIVRIKTHWIEELLISLESSWNEMSKMGLHDTFGHLEHKLWSKERSGVKLAIWLSTTKSWESPWLPCVQVTCHIPSKSSQWGLQLCFKPHLNCRSAHKVMGPQSCKNPNFGNFGTPTWESRDKMAFGHNPASGPSWHSFKITSLSLPFGT